MPGEPVVPVSGVMVGNPEIRFTDAGTAVARFRMQSVPRVWNANARAWEEGAPVRYICTVWRKVAEHVAESLIDGVAVLVFGRITGADGNVLYISVDDIGVGLRDRIVYTETSLPSPQAAAPQRIQTPVGGPESVRPDKQQEPEAASGSASGPAPQWWRSEREQGWGGFARIAARATSDPGAFRIT
ncbi:single-stranded DNA-binding protein [Streptomyces sp. 8N706]|uniref:single-stranded DNA-binding protein n=1 Tax=Streptomyces sp. 8N706 TaxID=3457416 RepID=UPI003FD3EC0E